MKLFRTQSKTPAAPAPKKKRTPQDAIEWCEEAVRAEDKCDWARAVVCYRRALQQAPFCTDIRRSFENAIEQQINDALPQILANGDRAFHPLFGVKPASPNSDPEVPRKRAKPKARQIESTGNILVELVGRHTTALTLAAAILVTGVGLFAAAQATTFIGRMIGGDALPTISEVKLPDELAAQMTAANDLLAQGNAEKAAEKLRAAREQFPDHEKHVDPALAKALRIHGVAVRGSGDSEKAAEIFTEVTALDPNNSLNWIDLGRTLRDRARSSTLAKKPAEQREVLAQAEKAFQKALDISRTDSTALLGLAQVYDAKNDRDKATKAYEQIVAMAPESSREGEEARLALKNLKKR